MNAANLQELIKPQGGDSVAEVIRRNVLAVLEQEKATGKPMLPHLNHPNFGYGVTAEDIAEVVQEQFFEVFNGHPGVNQEGNATHASIDRLWDIANTIRIAKLKAAPLYGVGTDDSHAYQSIGEGPLAIKRSEPGRGWVISRPAGPPHRAPRRPGSADRRRRGAPPRRVRSGRRSSAGPRTTSRRDRGHRP